MPAESIFTSLNNNFCGLFVSIRSTYFLSIPQNFVNCFLECSIGFYFLLLIFIPKTSSFVLLLNILMDIKFLSFLLLQLSLWIKILLISWQISCNTFSFWCWTSYKGLRGCSASYHCASLLGAYLCWVGVWDAQETPTSSTSIFN